MLHGGRRGLVEQLLHDGRRHGHRGLRLEGPVVEVLVAPPAVAARRRQHLQRLLRVHVAAAERHLRLLLLVSHLQQVSVKLIHDSDNLALHLLIYVYLYSETLNNYLNCLLFHTTSLGSCLPSAPLWGGLGPPHSPMSSGQAAAGPEGFGLGTGQIAGPVTSGHPDTSRSPQAAAACESSQDPLRWECAPQTASGLLGAGAMRCGAGGPCGAPRAMPPIPRCAHSDVPSSNPVPARRAAGGDGSSQPDPLIASFGPFCI